MISWIVSANNQEDDDDDDDDNDDDVDDVDDPNSSQARQVALLIKSICSLTDLHKPRRLPGLWRWHRTLEPGSVKPWSPPLPYQLTPSREPEAHLPTLPHATTHKHTLSVSDWVIG